MKTRLPRMFLGSPSSKLYQEFIKDFDERLYKEKRSDLLGERVLKKIAGVKGSPGVSDEGQSKKSKSGHIFEFLVAEMLIMHEILPFYTQASMWKVPFSKFDFLLFHEDKPVVLSCKKSFGDRWIEAEAEGIVLKGVYRQGECYLLVGDTSERVQKDVAKRKEDLKKAHGLNGIFTVGSETLPLFKRLSKRTFSLTKPIDPVVKKLRVVSKETLEAPPSKKSKPSK